MKILQFNRFVDHLKIFRLIFSSTTFVGRLALIIAVGVAARVFIRAFNLVLVFLATLLYVCFLSAATTQALIVRLI